MLPIVVLNCFKLCLFVLICTEEAAGYASGAVDDPADNVALDDAVSDGAADDAVVDEEADDAVADSAVKDATADSGVDDADVDDGTADEGVDDVGGDNGVADEQTADNADKKPDADLPADDQPDNLENKDVGLNSTTVKDKEPSNTGEQGDIGPVGDNGLSNNSSTSSNNTSVKPAFKLTLAEIKKFKLWPGGKVPYYIDQYSYDKVLRDKIREHFEILQKRLLLLDFHELLEPPTDDNERYVFFVNRRGQLDCKDYSTKSFTDRGVQKVVLGYDCINRNGAMAATVMAILGIPPMHNAPDRDTYITIHEDHILPDKKGLFKRINNDEWLFHEYDYDYSSASHYPFHKYTADGHKTISINELKPGSLNRSDNPLQKPQKSETELFKERAMNALTTGQGEANDYSNNDLGKLYDLYAWLSNKHKSLKFEDCKALYRSKPGLSTRLDQQEKVPEKSKPKLYLAAVQKLTYNQKDEFGETLSSLERK